ncbi:MAG: hypothetical protein JRE27_12130, partial [Deltaproteobacteria bacterium]|nr:hypothetical protein [Deltaproteobacteria bacterium]
YPGLNSRGRVKLYNARMNNIKNEIIPLVRQVGRKKNVPVIDLYTPLSGKPHLFPDKVHPNAEGANLMAREIYKTLTGNPYPAN